MRLRNRKTVLSRSLPLLAGAVSFGVASVQASAQTSGTWIPTSTANVDWNTTSQWIGSVPGNGGVATFVQNTGSASSPAINNNYNLSQINITSSTAYSFAGSGSITFPATGGTININAVSGIANAYSVIGVQLAGGPLTVTGTGSVDLTKSNTFEGGTNISGGTILVASDTALGATDLSTDGVTLNSGTLENTSSFTTSRAISVSGTSTLTTLGTAVYNGVISGTGTLIKGSGSGAGLDFDAVNTFAGTLEENAESGGSSTGGIYLASNGALPDVAAIYANSYLRIDNTSAVSNQDRLSANTAIYMGGGLLRLATNAGVIFEEQAGSLALTDGFSIISIQNTNSGGSAVGLALTSGITRTNRATLYVRGNNVSDATPIASATIASLVSPTAPVGLSGVGPEGTANAAVVPWIVGDVSASGNLSGVTAQLFTWNASNGALRPLGAAEYASGFGVSTNNVQLNTSSPSLAVPTGGATCNSLTVTSSSSTGVTVTGSDPITVTSGAIVSNTAVSGYTGNTISAPIVFPAGVEGVLECGTNLTTTAPISGTNGVTISEADGWTITGNGDNSSYSGQTTIVAGPVQVSGNLPVNQNSAFGNSSTPIVVEGGDYANSTVQFTTASVVGRTFNLVSNEGGLGSVLLENFTGTESVTFNGNINMSINQVTVAFGDPALTPGVPAANVIFNGVISGQAHINEGTLNTYSYLQKSAMIFNGTNTFSGGITLQNGQIYAGNNSGFGTGTIITKTATSNLGLHILLPTIGATAGASGTDTLRTVANNIVIGGYGLNLNNAIRLNLSGSLTLSSNTEVPGTTPTILIDFGAPTTISGNVGDGSVGNTGMEIAGNVTLSGTNTFTGGVTLPSAASNISPDGTATSAGYVTFASPGALPAYSPLAIGAGATAVAANHGSGTYNSLLTSSVSLDPAGLIDLTNNALVIRSGSSIGTVTSAVAQGYSGGSWQGSSGITSGAAASNTTHLTALGVIVNDNGSGSPLYGSGGTIAGTFGGTSTTVDGDILVKYTYYGDANLDGHVDGSDYSRIDAAFLSQSTASPLTGWYNGDFNYDGVIDGSDYTLIDNAFNTQGASLAASIASPAAVSTAEIAGVAGSSAVPEPTSFALLGIGALGLIGRRRRHT
jgi:fibronectin-binding autotransporter adhesin